MLLVIGMKAASCLIAMTITAFYYGQFVEFNIYDVKYR